MGCVSQALLKILSTEVFQRILNNDILKVEQLLAAQKLLLVAGIPYDLLFSSGTRRQVAAAELIIYINPTTTIDFTIAFETGVSGFGGNLV